MKLSQIKAYINSLNEIDNILGAMKNLALIEHNKANRDLENVTAMMSSITAIGYDFFKFHPKLMPVSQPINALIFILIGSERGFCANFNELIKSELIKYLNKINDKNITIITIGQKLAGKVDDIVSNAKNNAQIEHIIIPGPSINDEINPVITTLLDYLKEIFIKNDGDELAFLDWNIIYNKSANGKIETKIVNLLSELNCCKNGDFNFAPIVNMNPNELYHKFIEDYILIKINSIFHYSLVAENDKRLKHLSGAKIKLEEKCNELSNKANILRQEQITEEIENILLSVDSFGQNQGI